MKAVLIGSIVNKPLGKLGDIDVIADTVPANAIKTVEDDFATSYKVELWDNIPLDVIVPKSGSSWQLVLNMHHDSGLTKISEHSLRMLMFASAILPGKNYRSWRDHMEWLHKNQPNYKSGYLERLKLFNTDPIFLLHRKECLTKAKKHPKLNQSKSEFFGKEKYDIFDHDDLHKAVAWENVPMYTKFLKGEVEVDKAAFDALPFSYKLACAYEECAVLSLERSLIPFFYLPDKSYMGDKETFLYALYKVCTTITSGWFRDFCILNYQAIIDFYDDLRPEERFRQRFYHARDNNLLKINNKEIVERMNSV